MSEQQYVGIDLHRRRSVIVRVSSKGEHLSTTRLANDPLAIMAAVADAGSNPEVVLEATYGWYWLVDLLQEEGARVHLASPSGLNWGYRRVKNDERDALDLVRKLRLDELPEAWIAPPPVRELREIVRYRAKLVQLRSGLKAQVHAVMAKEGILPARARMFGPSGRAQLDEMNMAPNYTTRVQSLRNLLDLYDREVVMLEAQIHAQLRDHPGYGAIQAIPGIGRTLAGGLHRRDRRREPLRLVRAPVLLGRAHPQAPGVRHQGRPGPDHQAGLQARAVGGRGGGGQEQRRHRLSGPVPSPGRAPRQEQGPGGCGPTSAHPRLLRAAGRPHPLSATRGGGVSRLATDRTRARFSAWLPTERSRVSA